MNVKNKYVRELLVKILKSSHYKIVYFLVAIAISYAFLYLDVKNGVFFACFDILLSPCMIFVICSICISSIIISKECNNYKFAIQRLNDKENFIKTILFLTIINSTIIITVVLASHFFIASIRCLFEYSSPMYYYYNISFTVYYIFYIIKLYCLLILLSIIGVLFIQLFNKIISSLLYFFISLSVLYSGFTDNGIINSLTKFRISFSYYLTIEPYESFPLEILFASLYALGLTIIANFLYEILKRKVIEVK